MIQVIPFKADADPLFLEVLSRGLSDLTVVWLNAALLGAKVNPNLAFEETEWKNVDPADSSQPIERERELWMTGRIRFEQHLIMDWVIYDPGKSRTIYYDVFEAPEAKFLATWATQLRLCIRFLQGSAEARFLETPMYTDSLEAFLEFRQGLECLAQAKNQRLKEKGLEGLLNAVAYDPGFTEAADILILFLLQNDLANNFDYSIGLLERLRQIAPDYSKIPLVMAEIYLQFHNEPKGEQLLEELVKQFPDFADGWIRLALFHYNANRPEEALQKLKTLLEFQPDNLVALDLMGAIYAGKGETESAREVWLKALDIDPSRVNIWNNLGLLMEEEQRQDQAEKYYKRAIQLTTQWWGSFFNYGSFCRRQGRLDEAVLWLTKAGQLNPDHFPIFLYLGMALFDLGRFGEAQEALVHLLQLAPDNMTRSQSLELLERFDQPEIQTGIRIRQLERTWEANQRRATIFGLLQIYHKAKTDWYYWYLWGRIALEFHQKRITRIFWQQGLKYHPGFTLLKRFGLYYWEEKQPKMALPLLRQAYRLNNCDPEINQAYLAALMSRGEMEEYHSIQQRTAEFAINETNRLEE